MQFFQLKPSPILQQCTTALIANHRIIYISSLLLKLRYSSAFHPLLGWARYLAPSTLILLFSRFSNLRLGHLVSIRKPMPSGPILLLASCSSVILPAICMKLAMNSCMPWLPMFRLLISKMVFISYIHPLMIQRVLGVTRMPLFSSSPPSVCMPTMKYSFSLVQQKMGLPLCPGLVQIWQFTYRSLSFLFRVSSFNISVHCPLLQTRDLHLPLTPFTSRGYPATINSLNASVLWKPQTESSPKQPYFSQRLWKFLSLTNAKSYSSAYSSDPFMYQSGTRQADISIFSPTSTFVLISFPFSLIIYSFCYRPRVKVACEPILFSPRWQKLCAQVSSQLELIRNAVPLILLFSNCTCSRPMQQYGYLSDGDLVRLSTIFPADLARGLRMLLFWAAVSWWKWRSECGLFSMVS